jgi:hypothetical protein
VPGGSFALCDYQAASQAAARSASERRAQERARAPPDEPLGLANVCKEKDERVAMPAG